MEFNTNYVAKKSFVDRDIMTVPKTDTGGQW